MTAKKKNRPAQPTRFLQSKTKLLKQISHFLAPQRSNNHRPQILHPESLIFISILTVGFFALVQTFRFFPNLKNSVLGYAANISVEDVVSQTNQQRAKSGLQPLVLNSQLSQAALAKAQDMFDHQYWAHTSPQGKEPWDFIKQANYTYKVAGENLARDFNDTASMVKAWMASPTHKANIMNGKYKQIGIAVVDGTLQGFETTLVVQMFGTPQVQAAAIGSEASADQATAQSQAQAQVVQVQGQESAEKLVSKSVSKPVQPVRETVSIEQQAQENGVLASAIVPIGQLKHSPLFTPLQLTKAFFLAVILLIVLTLVYDSLVIGHRKTMRLVGQNLGHIILLSCVAFLMIFFKGGMIK